MSTKFLDVVIGKVKLGELISPDYNPTKDIREDPETYEQLQGSLTKFGYANLITVNKKNGHILGGNQRYKVICDELEDRGVDWENEEITVQFVDLEESAEKALNSALNHIKEEDDLEKLITMIDEISVVDADLLDLTGFDANEIEDLRNEAFGDKKKEDDNPKEAKDIDDLEAVFEVKVKIPHEYFDTYKKYIKENTDAGIASAIIKEIMGVGSSNGDMFRK